MNVSRTGAWLTFDTVETDSDAEFLDSINAVLVERSKSYRVKYDERVFDRVSEYIQETNGSMDATCLALATFKADWLVRLEETKVRTKRNPMKHQAQGVTFLLQLEHALLGFDMGTGKSKTATDTASHLFDIGAAKNAIIVTDASVVEEWTNVLIPEDTDYPAISLLGSRTDRITRLRWGKAQGAKFFVINYDGIEVILDELRRAFDHDTILILDEVQRIKNHTTARFKTLWKLYTAHDNKYLFELSGSPTTQGPEDAFAEYAFLDTKIFGHPKSDWYSFRATYVQTAVHDNHIVVGYRNMKRFLRHFHSRCFRVRTEDVLDLPPKVFKPIRLNLPTKIEKVYKEYVKSQGFVRIPGHPAQGERDELYVAMHPFTRLRKSLQIINNFIYLTREDEDENERTEVVTLFDDVPNPKIDFLMQLLEDTDQQIVVWFVSKAMKMMVSRALLDARVPFVTVDGGVPIEKRQPLIQTFLSGKARVIVAQQRTIRTGVKLTCSRINVYMENDFSVETRQQSEKRTHRLGMDESAEGVLYFDLLYNKTAEVVVYDRLIKGQELNSAIVDLDNIQLILTGAWDVK